MTQIIGLGVPVLVLNRHSVRVNRLLARHTFKAQEDASVVILVTLHDEATLLVPVNPGDAYKVLL
jgi:hypothetical protein